jgi:hypothetical protein
MPGKNQTKRQNKNIAHAKLVWTRKALGAANAWAGIKDAISIITEHSGELTEEDMLLIQAQVDIQKTNIADTLAAATDELYKKVGDDVADAHVASFLPESVQKQLGELS